MFVVAHNGARVFGGAERGVARILAGLQARGHRVLMICTDRMVADQVQTLGVPVQVAPLGGDVSVHHAAGLALLLRRLRPDVLVIGTFKKLWLATLAARMARVPRVIARIGLESDLPRNLKYRLTVPWLDAVVLKADDVRPRWREALPHLNPARLVTIYGAVTPPEVRREAGSVRAELGIDPSAPVIGTVARLARQKRLDRLVRVLSSLPDTHAIIAGDGKLMGEIEAQAEEAGVRDRLHLLGHRDDVGDVLAALDLFIVCSDKEMLAFSMLEALAAGVPVVSTPVSGAHEALDSVDGRAPGAVVGWEEGEMAETIGALLADSVRRDTMRAEALRRARDVFGFERMLDAWERVLAGVPA